jgi:glycosyltransferase involved in cell wall biosynthesis
MIRVLALTSDTDGVGNWRIISPNLSINDSDIEVDVRMWMDGTMQILDDRFLSQYNIIFFNKVLPFNKPEYTDMFFKKCDELSISVVFDIDDYWVLNSSHLNYDAWKKSGGDKTTIEMITKSDAVTTTTSLFVDKIKEYNTNVYVLENAVNLKEQQWLYNKRPSDKIRFLWGGGISHMADLRLLIKSFEKFAKNKDFLSKCQFYMCGYDLRMKTIAGTLQTSEWRKNQWTFFEDIFTFKGKYITNPEHKQYLLTNDDTNYGINEKFINEFYQRRWTRPIMTYGHMYNEADVCLAPLKSNNLFNYYKSNLKIVEAGAHHCPIIASNFGPYTLDDIEGVNDGIQKGFLIDEDDTDGWYNKIIYYMENPDIMKQHGENLYNYIKNNLSTDVVGKKRAEVYKKIVSEKNNRNNKN